eukprot:CAMPEP_0170482480 /NCGR_PEP_ID=MMETSP0208-20121228/2479_1 /TAXON_ID=197538 /ORGANISM="Strombidium inclinatum, Strain S3" /LENGTH=54 /DNA_ID=CAMNT_0010755321 /DNA_START=104 /DNA_END=268 /DNA_ORIENTATION=+
MGISEQKIPVKKAAKKLGIEDPEDLEAGIQALAYLMLHFAKVKASEEEFVAIYE